MPWKATDLAVAVAVGVVLGLLVAVLSKRPAPDPNSDATKE